MMLCFVVEGRCICSPTTNTNTTTTRSDSYATLGDLEQ
jgi:hypothetical protein